MKKKVTELRHIVPYVRDLERSRKFYPDVLGWEELPTPASMSHMVTAFASGRIHHEMLLMEVGASAAPLPPGRRVGLYHFGIKVGETDDELREALGTLQAAGVKIVGTSDHGVTHSLYIEDPDGNKIEIYSTAGVAGAPRGSLRYAAAAADVKPIDGERPVSTAIIGAGRLGSLLATGIRQVVTRLELIDTASSGRG